MVSETLARRYAAAVFSLAQERHCIDEVGSDLQTIASAIADDPTTHEFFVSPVVERAEKEQVLRAAFEGKANEVAVHALLLLVRKRREAVLGPMIAEYGKLRLAATGLEPLTVRSAHPLDPAALRHIVERIERAYHKRFEVTHVVDPELIGGIRILMGDRRIDGTVSGRLEALARTLLSSN